MHPGVKHRDDVKVSFTVMAHKKRKDWAEQVAGDIGCDITWDRINDRHDTGVRAIEAFDPDADWHVVVQDDVQLAPDFADGVREALKWVPAGVPVSFYHGGNLKTSGHSQAFDLARQSGVCWLERKGPVWGPAIAYPTDNILALTDYFRGSVVQNYDRRVMNFYQSQGILCWYSVPSLVDHKQEENPSLCGHDDRGLRVAREFVGPRSALSVDWSKPVLKGVP